MHVVYGVIDGYQKISLLLNSAVRMYYFPSEAWHTDAEWIESRIKLSTDVKENQPQLDSQP